LTIAFALTLALSRRERRFVEEGEGIR